VRILAFSDVVDWAPYRRVVDKWKPAVVALAGDLTSDGGAAFWHTALEAIPAFRRAMADLRRRLGVKVSSTEGYDIVPRKSWDKFRDGRWALERRYRNTPAFRHARKRLHVEKFYAFLKYAGKRAVVLVISGDHDDDFPGDYDACKIDAIPGCHEISSKVHSVNGVTFLGLGFDQAGYRRPLRQIVLEQGGQVDVVIAHPPQKNVRIVAELQPGLLIRGHFGWGCHLIDGVPTVFTSGGHAVIDTRRKKPPRIRMLNDDPLGPTSTWLLRRNYPWLMPYPGEKRDALSGIPHT